MKKIFLGALLFCFTIQVNGQEYNKWSIDIGGGAHEIINPLSPGYETGSLSLGQASLGIRYMFNEKFGLRLDVGYNEFKEGENSLPFTSNSYRANIQGVLNAGSLLKFSSWTKRFNLLFHGGMGLSTLKTLTPIDNGNGEQIINLMFGFTPQFKLSNRISLFLDASAILHDRQNFTFDGAPITSDRRIGANIFNTSIGLNISLGKHKVNADFLQNEEVFVKDELKEINKRLDFAEKEIANLMVQKNEKSGINKVALITELDNRYAKKEDLVSNRYASVVTGSNVDFIRKLLNSGYINVYFDVNKKEVQEGSLNSVNYLIQFMKDNRNVSAQLIGFADETGKENQNQTLSKNRAKGIFDILVSAGIHPSRLSFAGGGEDKSVTKKARQFARKVTFRIN
jgi:OOP family OmpA-OmpF porin